MPQPEASLGAGEPVSVRTTIDDDEIKLEPARLEPLTAAQEAEAVELLAAPFAAAARRRAERGPLKEAA